MPTVEIRRLWVQSDTIMLESIRNATIEPLVKPMGPIVRPSPPKLKPDLEPPYHVILHDDDTHSYQYVIDMLMAIFGYEFEKGYKMACEVDESSRVIVATCHKELAELRVEQIHEFGADPSMKESTGSMKASMEPAE